MKLISMAKSHLPAYASSSAKIHPEIDPNSCSLEKISQDPVVYSPQEIKNLLQRIDEGNRATGGLNSVAKVFGIAALNCLQWKSVEDNHSFTLGTSLAGYYLFTLVMDYSTVSATYRPSPADANFLLKYNVRSVQGGGKSTVGDVGFWLVGDGIASQ
ncbi:hypothetical protein Patl1_10705 [Pistacia atlantica]|uniref:Uncharacterized protein n=1 Tax=Pistacia atlantica TaxID=434234 RepID=A0ACC1A8M2_9ROSI|nr:hypothetical protein Patl1_10705 [Pistacia atlantica]